MVLLTAFIAISLGGAMPLARVMTRGEWEFAVVCVAILSPLWVPLVFLAYAVGRRALTPRILALFGVIEGAMCAALYIWTR